MVVIVVPAGVGCVAGVGFDPDMAAAMCVGCARSMGESKEKRA